VQLIRTLQDNKENESFVERSLKNLEVEALDHVQLHCPPTEVFYMPEVFDVLDGLVKAGKLRYYGVSVEKVEEALKAIEYPNVQTVQIIFNIFRQRPLDLFLRRGTTSQSGNSGAGTTFLRHVDRKDDSNEYVR
jgi:aryl-alcohol dehydrogenase-like predicted oxidoreductase